jgi:hypothetical protein
LLIGGPTSDEFSTEDLRAAWRYHGDQIMANHKPGSRPWGFWTFVLGEEQPRSRWDEKTSRSVGDFDEAVRLAQLGQLDAGELAALREQANESRMRVGTDRERLSGGGREHGVSLDRKAVELFEAVLAARRRAG